MVVFSYAICVCNESRELYSLIAFLKKVKDTEDEINILVDTAHVSKQVLQVLDFFKNDIVTYERAFIDGNFSDHRNYHISKCKGDYIFVLDADEMPQEKLIKNIKGQLIDDMEIIYIPRINILPGSTQDWLNKSAFIVNEAGWINWPDMQSRIFKNIPSTRYTGNLHEILQCTGKTCSVQIDPTIALWHIKSIEKQTIRWEENGEYSFPKGDNSNLYDTLM